MTVDNRVGKLEFYWTGSTWTGRVWFDAYQQWEELMDIYFDPHTGQLQFTRPNFNSRYNGSLSGNQIIGTFIYAGVSYPWEARRF
jgi:fructose-1,6-bisphosphatase